MRWSKPLLDRARRDLLDAGLSPGGLGGEVLRWLVVVVDQELDADRDHRDDEKEDEVERGLAREARAVAVADDLTALVLPHRVDARLVVAREPLLDGLALEHRAGTDRRCRGTADVLQVLVARTSGALLLLRHPAGNITPTRRSSPPTTVSFGRGPARGND